VLGGEHSITIGIVKSLFEISEPFSIVQFDAHSDQRNYYQGYYDGHGSVMRRIYELTPSIFQLGIRSIGEPEYKFIKGRNIEIVNSSTLIDNDVSRIVDDLCKHMEESIYITFDVDFFSMDVVRNVGTPEPGGVGWYKTLQIMKSF